MVKRKSKHLILSIEYLNRMTDEKKSFLRRIPGFRSGTPWKMILAIIGYGLIALIIIGALLPGESPSPSSSTASAAGITTTQRTRAPTAMPTSTENVIEKGCLALDGDNWGWTTGQYGNRFITGTIENTCSKKLSYAQVTFILTDDAGNQVGSALDNINDLEGGATWKFNAIVLEDSATHAKFGDMTSF